MLTKKHQLLLISLLEKDLTRQNNKIYGSVGFYGAVSYLEKNNLVKRYQKKDASTDKLKTYAKLTFKGEVLAGILAGFVENSINVRRFGLE